MNIAISTLCILSQPFSLIFKIIKKYQAKFHISHWEIIDEGLHKLNVKRINHLKKLANELELKYTIHAPFADINIASLNPKIKRLSLNIVKNTIILGGMLNARLVTIHPGSLSGLSLIHPNQTWKSLLESIHILADFAVNHNVILCVENMIDLPHLLLRNPGEIKRLMSQSTSKNVKLTLDIGHANISASPMEFINTLNPYIRHTHIHDNDGKLDTHKSLGEGNINWRNVLKALQGFDGWLSLEHFSLKDVDRSIYFLKGITST